MEQEKNKKLSIILIGVSIGLVISIAGISVYKFYPRNDIKIANGKVSKPVEVKHTKEDDNTPSTNTNDKVVLNEEDVKKWLDKHDLIEFFYILNENDFDSKTATKKQYNGFLGLSILFGGLYADNSIESISLNDGKYNNQYSYTTSFIKNLLNDYLGVGIDVVDIDQLNNDYKDLANFSMDNNTFTVKVVATGLDDYKTVEIEKINLNNDNNIVVRYNLKDCMVNGSPDNCLNVGSREVILKKTDNGYNLLKAYKVEN